MDPLDPIKPYSPDTFGSASFMTRLEAVQLKLSERGEGNKLCPYVGGLVDGSGAGDTATMIYARGASYVSGQSWSELREGSGHLLTVAPTRAGKGTGQIVPNLLRWAGSCIVVDVKGENYKLSAGFRKHELKQRVIRFAPFEIQSEIWNPIMSIRIDPGSKGPSPQEEEDARYLVNLIVTPSGNSNDRFWENSARNFLEGLILHVRTGKLVSRSAASEEGRDCEIRERSMREVRRLLTLEERPFTDLLREMAKSPRPVVHQAARTMLRLIKGEGRTGTSVLAVCLEQTAVWAYERVHQVTYKPSDNDDDLEPAKNDFDFQDLRDGLTSLYLIIPPEYLSEYRSILRVLIGTAMRELRRSHNEDSKKKPPVLFLLDEFPQLGYMQPIEQALLYIAGYNVRFWFFVQDMSQLQLHYPDSWRTFMANTGTQCFFGVSDIATANLVSEMAGTTTVENRSIGANVGRQESEGGADTKTTGTSETSGRGGADGWFWGGPSNWSKSDTTNSSEAYTTNWQTSLSVGHSTQVGWVGRRLITPDEVMRMHDEEQLVFMKGLKPIRAAKMPYYKNRDLAQLAQIKPPRSIEFE